MYGGDWKYTCPSCYPDGRYVPSSYNTRPPPLSEIVDKEIVWIPYVVPDGPRDTNKNAQACWRSDYMGPNRDYCQYHKPICTRCVCQVHNDAPRQVCEKCRQPIIAYIPMKATTITSEWREDNKSFPTNFSPSYHALKGNVTLKDRRLGIDSGHTNPNPDPNT